MIPNFKKSKHANKGKKAEDAVAKVLQAWVDRRPHGRDYERLLDSKAAGRIIKASKADFEFFCFEDIERVHGLIEVKETEHLYRLERPKVPQLAAMRKRENCGGHCFIVVHHSIPGTWRVAPVHWLANNGDKGSWNLSKLPEYDSAAIAIFNYDRMFSE